jgi:hypothetical protein
MALTGSYTSKFGTTHESAYAKIVNIDIDNLNNKATAIVFIYATSAAREARNKPIAKIQYEFSDSTQADNVFEEFLDINTLDNDNPFSIIYAWMKTKDEWSGWNDA